MGCDKALLELEAVALLDRVLAPFREQDIRTRSLIESCVLQ